LPCCSEGIKAKQVTWGLGGGGGGGGGDLLQRDGGVTTLPVGVSEPSEEKTVIKKSGIYLKESFEWKGCGAKSVKPELGALKRY